MSFKRNSPIYFIPAQETASKHGIGFTSISLLAGWWGLPWGPIWTWRTAVNNMRGGIDVTKNVMLTLQKRGLPSCGLIGFYTPQQTASYLHFPTLLKLSKKMSANLSNSCDDGAAFRHPLSDCYPHEKAHLARQAAFAGFADCLRSHYPARLFR